MASTDHLPASAPAFDPEGTGKSAASARTRRAPFGILALVCSAVSLATCYASLLLQSVFGIPQLGLNRHVQAAVMVGFALIAVYALWQDRKHHGHLAPATLGTIATGVLIVTIYIRYSTGVESLAYVLLVVAALLNQTVFLAALSRKSRDQAREIALLNDRLALKVENQSHDIDRLARLKTFLSPQVADLVVSESKDTLLDTHRRYIACLFCDIRGFTRLSEDIEPEEVISILQDYHDRIGRLTAEHAGTIGFRAGDGLMVFFNDPLPCEAPVLDAIRLALEIRACFEGIRAPWLRLGHPIGIGLAVASGYATLGLVGYHGRADYTAIGGVVNIASRLCDRAAHGQILLTRRAHADVEANVEVKALGAYRLRGVKSAIEVYDVLGVRSGTS